MKWAGQTKCYVVLSIALNFLAQKGDPISKNITLKEFAKQNKIGENTIRNQIKFLTK
jgi:hypothetical protein